MSDLEFHVDVLTSVRPAKVFDGFDDAVGFAVIQALSTGMKATVDVIVWSESGARVWGGDDAVEQYREDPDASVFERIEISANSLGRVP